ncbi:2TM domain-containing protein [Maribacter algicola]|uniref:2TM domain-containing protein n=1 Tax=Meishania litoralis TaxID=3434685 RepID=A0ACC7LL76_9FLAO
MEIEENSERAKLRRARKKVEELKGFYWHMAIYLTVNLFISISKISRNMFSGESFGEGFLEFETFAVWVFWGVGLAFHAVKVFSLNPIFGKKWEERQIKKYMEQDSKEVEKFR